MLGANLRSLSSRAVSISALCRELGINRTQYNRYLSGESFPRPDVLSRICDHFQVDARILLEPVDSITPSGASLLNHPELAEFTGPFARSVPEERFPSGFYHFSRRAFIDDSKFAQGLIYIYRRDGATFLKGFEARVGMRLQGLSTAARNREFRGAVLAQDEGVAFLVSRRGGSTTSFNYLAHLPSFENNFWVGYVARTVREGLAGRRVERVVFEHLNRDRTRVMTLARAAGLCSEDDLPPFHRQQLRVGQPFE